MARHRGYEGAVVVVTGAGSGIGRALALLLGAQKACLVLVGRRSGPLQDCAASVADAGGTVPLVAPCDVTDADAVTALAARVVAELGPARVLVNNAGRGGYGPFADVPLATHRAVIDTNLTGVVQVTHAFLAQLLSAGGGQLVLVSSVLGELPAPDHAVYGATKFAVTAFGESLRHELHGRDVTVTVVEPGLVRSGFAAISGTPAARFDQVPSKTPEQAAAVVLRAMQRRQAHLVADRLSAAAIVLRRHAPRCFAALFGVAFRRAKGRG